MYFENVRVYIFHIHDIVDGTFFNCALSSQEGMYNGNS